jgi:hypothetical protein
MSHSLTYCTSYAPGHQVHWIQAKVKRTEPRYDARVEVLTGNKIRVSFLDQSKIFSHHAVEQIQAALNKAVLGHIKFAPTASLLYVQTEEPNGQHYGAFSMSYLCEGELTDCLSPSPDAVSIEDIELED